jgi:hypothetical protein
MMNQLSIFLPSLIDQLNLRQNKYNINDFNQLEHFFFKENLSEVNEKIRYLLSTVVFSNIFLCSTMGKYCSSVFNKGNNDMLQ